MRCGNKLAAHFNSETMTDRTELLDILEEWGNSLMEGVDESGNTEGPIPCMQHAQLTGIWTLFEDVETAKYVREYMYEKHPLLSKYLGATVD